MLDKKVEKALNEQINKEFFSAYLYLSMAAYFEEMNLKGFANWMHIQYQEEIFHGMKIFNFISNRDGKVVLTAIDEPAHTWKSPLEVFEASLEHEKKVTGWINDLVKHSHELKDYATASFLQWYVDEQVEEESSVTEIIQKLKLIGSDKSALIFLDAELGKRQFIAPATTAVK